MGDPLVDVALCWLLPLSGHTGHSSLWAVFLKQACFPYACFQWPQRTGPFNHATIITQVEHYLPKLDKDQSDCYAHSLLILMLSSFCSLDVLGQLG